MTMQKSEKFAGSAKSKAKSGSSKKMQVAAKEENPGEMVVKLEGQVKNEPDQTDEKPTDSRQFNGHLESDKDGNLVPSSTLRPPTRDPMPANPRMMVGPNGQMEGLTPAGLRMPVMPGVGGMPMGGHVQVAAGGHFVQNHSPIFVFSTTMANLAAEAYERGHYDSIIHFHKNHPDTQQFLQKYPLGSLHPGMNMRPDANMRPPNMADGIPESGSALANVAQWVQQQNANLQQLSSHSPGMNFIASPDGPGLRPNGRYGRMQQWGPSPGPQLMPPEMVGPQGYPMCGPQGGFSQDMNMAPGDMIHDSMTKDNLTPQQLQKREQSLANLRKIKEILLPELQSNVDPSGPGSMMNPQFNPDGVMPGDGWPPQMMHQNMAMQRPGMAMSPDTMMGVNFMPRMGPGRPMMGPGGVPPNWETMTPEEREWRKLEHDFYMEKCQKQQIQIGVNMPPGGGGAGPNRSQMGFFHPMQQMHRMSGPMSPSFPGNSVPSPHCGSMGNPNDPQSMMFTKQPDFGPVGPDQGFDPSAGLPREGMFPFGDNQMPPGRFGSTGEPFSPADFSHPINQPGMGKMPPMYASQKRKRSANTLPDDELYKRLLPAPSPQQFSYMNTLEGQELTITKQLNLAFQEQPGAQLLPTSVSPPTYPPPQKSRPSGAKKKKGQSKAADQKSKSQRALPAADSFMCPSPAVPSSAPAASASLQAVLAASPISQTSASSMSSSLANVTPTAVTNRAPSADPSGVPASVSMALPMKSSMTNITSASLANLAKGVENLSAQIQQNPFRTVQMQENESDVSDVSPADNNSLLPPIGSVSHNQMSQPTIQSTGSTFSGASNSVHPMQGCGSSTQPMTPTNPMGSPPGSVRSVPLSMVPKSGSNNLSDPSGLVACQRQSPALFPGEDSAIESGQRYGFPCSGAISTGPSTNQQMFSPMGSSPGMSALSGCRPPNSSNMVTGNAKIQIQAQTPNTIQYLPSNPGSVGPHGDDGFLDFNADGKPCGKMVFNPMMDGMHGPMIPGDMVQRREIDMQMMSEARGGMQMRMDPAFDPMHGQRVSIHVSRGPGGPGHLPGGPMQDPTSPMLGPGPMMHGMGNPMHRSGSPIMGPSGPMMDQTSPMGAPGTMIGPGGIIINDMLPMQGHMKQGMGPSGAGDFGPMMIGPGGRGEMQPEMVPMAMQRRAMHPDAMMMSGPEFGMPHRDPAMMRMMPGCNMMGPEMGMVSMAGREGMIMRGGGLRSEMVAERSRSNRSRQKARTAEAESRLRNDPGTGMMVADAGGNRMAGTNQGMISMEMMGGLMRPDMMSMQSMGPGDRMGLRPDPGMMMPRGNGMPSEMAMMGSRGVAGGRMGMMEGPGMPPESVGMFNFRRGMPPDAMDMCPPGMMSSGMNASGMCPPGMKSMVMGSPGVGQPPGPPGMGSGDPGYGVQYQQFQQQIYAQSRSPTMSPVMMRSAMAGAPPDIMGRPPYDVIGSGPGMVFGQPQPGLGPSGSM